MEDFASIQHHRFSKYAVNIQSNHSPHWLCSLSQIARELAGNPATTDPP
jgi:hypothetical protein